MLRNDRGEHRPGLVRFRDVEDLAFQELGQVSQRGFVTICHDDRRTKRLKVRGDRKPEPSRAPGDKGDCAVNPQGRPPCRAGLQ